MRTLSRRSLLAGALAVMAPATQLNSAQADEQSGSIRIKSDGAADSATDSTLAVESRDGGTSAEEQAQEQQLALGQSIANYALAYVGYPYVAAGNSPAGFDCSGFTQYVMLNMLGWDIGHAVEGQPAAGYWVDWDLWMPGDLIFFQNTYRAGISHVGIYIGDGLFVHAENEGTGVVVTSLYSDYYLARYWGAIRLI
jgi:cell wall-associated NlpC family hydrolase